MATWAVQYHGAHMMAAPAATRIHAVIVTFQPEEKALLELLAALSFQVARIHMVDNTAASDRRVETLLRTTGLQDIQLIRLGENYGIAKALNVGIEAAMAADATHVLLSDQDSLPATDMVNNLFRAFEDLSFQGMRIGAVGPTFTDMHTHITYPFQTRLPGNIFYGHGHPTSVRPHVEALTLITSGTLIPVDVIKDVGPMREDLFIDNVDVEWCHRAYTAGYRLFGTGWASMYQRMGEARLRVWYIHWRYESAYKPLRIYYRMRNQVALCKMGNIDLRWKIRSSWFMLGILYSHVIFGEQRMNSLRMGLKGIWHGLRGRMGRYPDNQRTRGNP